MIDKIFRFIFAAGIIGFGAVWTYTAIMGAPNWEVAGLMILCSVFFQQSRTDMRLNEIEAWIKDIDTELNTIPTPAWTGGVDVINEAGTELVDSEGKETT